jgi:hypothetical protein
MERVIGGYRKQRLDDARKEEKRSRFGRVYPIGRDDYTREVTEASGIDEDGDQDGKGTGVVCFLYKDGCVEGILTLVPFKSSAHAPQDLALGSISPSPCNTRFSVPPYKICLNSGLQMYPQPPGFAHTHDHHISERRNPKSGCCLGR